MYESRAGARRHTGTPPIAVLMSAKPARLTAAKCEIGSPVSCWTAPIVARAPAADAARTTAGSFGESGAAASAAKRLVLPVGPAAGHGVGRLRRGARPGRIDLVSAEALPQVDVGVARYRDRGGATAARGHVHDGQRVGRPAAGIARAGVERGQDVAGQLVALRVGAGVETDEQDVLLARRRGLGRVDDGRGRRGSIQCAQLRPPEGGSEEDGHRQDAQGETRERIARAASAGRGRPQTQRSPFSARRHLSVQGISVIATRWSSACAPREIRRPVHSRRTSSPHGTDMTGPQSRSHDGPRRSDDRVARAPASPRSRILRPGGSPRPPHRPVARACHRPPVGAPGAAVGTAVRVDGLLERHHRRQAARGSDLGADAAPGPPP